MKIVIIGAGVSGSVLSDLLSKQKHEVTIIEKSKIPGGMCKSYYKDGFTYEYGPHILATHHSSQRTKEYIKSKIEVKKTFLTSASYVNNTITYYPPSIHSAKKLGIHKKVLNEIARLPKFPNMENFETYLMDKVGKTLYEKFFKNFTSKFWNIDPKKLSADWALIRKLGSDLTSKKMFFNSHWCSYPKKDWNEFFHNCLKNQKVIYDANVKTIDFNQRTIKLNDNSKITYDLCISSMHIDELLNFKFGKLDYAGYRINTKIIKKIDEKKIDNKVISMLYFPERKFKHCRITNYGSFQNKKDFPYNDRTILTVEYPDSSIRLYPFTDKKNLKNFEKHIIDLSKINNIISFGRLGLYKYLTTDTTVEMAFRLLPFVSKWKKLSPTKRFDAYKTIRGNWGN
jgi:UDP-galactopyranose mutase